MAVGEQFAGLDMGQLIGGPLTAAAQASTMLANTTADFINAVGFDSTGKLRTAAFAYQKRSMNEDGTSNLDEMKVDVPMLAIVPIPNLQIDEVNILFDMEVKESSTDKLSMGANMGLRGSARFGPIRVSVSGSVSVHKENTRTTDNSAKYHVDVRATNHGTPEGLARVLDMMAANVAPSLVNSTLKGGDGQTLQEDAKQRAEKLKTLRQEISRIEVRLEAAENNVNDRIALLKRVGSIQQNIYQAEMARLKNSEDNQGQEGLAQQMGQVTQSWNNLQDQAESLIRMIADSAADGAESGEVSDLFALMAFKENTAQKYGKDEVQHDALLAAQNGAVAARKKYLEIEKELYDKKEEYSSAVSGSKS